MEERVIEDKPTKMSDRRHEALYYLNFIIWPLGVLLVALRHWNRSWSKNVLWMFCIFFGYTFIIPEVGTGAADSDVYAQRLVEYASSDMNFGELWRSFYAESGNVDIAQPLITYLVSRITDSASWLFALFGLFFGFFYSRNIWYILDRVKLNHNALVFIYILTFALFNSIWNINNFRMWIAAQIFLFGTLPYLLEGNRKRLVWSVVSVFFHFSFLFPLVVLFLFIFLKNKLNIYLGFFIVTAFLKELDLQFVQSALSFLPAIFQPRIMSYTNPDYAEIIRQAGQAVNWYLSFSAIAIRCVIYSMTLFIYFSSRKFLKDRQDLMTLFCYSLLLYGFANFLSYIPSMDRFLTVGNTFMFAFFIVFISTNTKIRGFGLIKALSIPLLLLFCIVTIRVGMDYFSLMTIFGNPIFAVLATDTVSLITGIKMLF